MQHGNYKAFESQKCNSIYLSAHCSGSQEDYTLFLPINMFYFTYNHM